MTTDPTILHPTDFSDSSAGAFQFACSLARDRGARLLILHVVEPPATSVGGSQAVPPTPEELGLDEERAKLNAVKPTDESLRTEHRLEVGHTADTVLRVARETGCDLIVMGTHGRTGLGRVLMGSVAEQVLRRAPCPVLTVRAGAPS